MTKYSITFVVKISFFMLSLHIFDTGKTPLNFFISYLICCFFSNYGAPFPLDDHSGVVGRVLLGLLLLLLLLLLLWRVVEHDHGSPGHQRAVWIFGLDQRAGGSGDGGVFSGTETGFSKCKKKGFERKIFFKCYKLEIRVYSVSLTCCFAPLQSP